MEVTTVQQQCMNTNWTLLSRGFEHPIRIISIGLIIFVNLYTVTANTNIKMDKLTKTYSQIFPEPWSLKDLQRSGEINKSIFQLLTTVWPWIMVIFYSMCEYCNSVHYNYNYQINVPFLLWTLLTCAWCTAFATEWRINFKRDFQSCVFT